MPLADRALVVGINRYPGISVLSGAENDAEDFCSWVTDPGGGGVAPTLARLIRSADFSPPAASALDARPVKEEIEKFFSEVNNAAIANNDANLGLKAGKRLWLYFSGHGFAPSLDRSGVLMANATTDEVHNIAAMLWANRLYEGGWFDDVLLFQDACRGRIADADLSPPFLRLHQAPDNQQRRRFYAFSAKNKKLSVEAPCADGKVRGVFTRTLLQGLRGDARDPKTGAVTTAQLKDYLQQNMRKLLSEADLQNDDISQMPEVFDPDPFDVVPAPPAPQIPKFPVRIAISRPDLPAHVEDASFQTVETIAKAPQKWPLQLPRGFYKVVVDGLGESLFQVTGALMPDGSAREVNVEL